MRRVETGSTWSERLLDNVIGLFSPDRAGLRGHFRRMDRDPAYRETILAALRASGYRAAKSAGGATPFGGGTASADAEILPYLPALRNRSRELGRDDPLASGLKSTFINNVIGTGLWPKPQAKDAAGNLDAEKNGAIERTWWRLANNLYRGERLTHSAAQRLRFGKVFEDGEVFRHSVKRSPFEPVWFEVVEADRVLTPPELSGKSNIRDGIERDADGVPVAVHVARAHPGDTLATTLSRNEFVRIEFPAIQQIGAKERPGQTRCVPAFHAILQDLRDLDLLLLASLKRVQIAACLSAFIKSPKGATNLLEMTAQTYGYKLDQALEPGMLFKLYPEESIDTLVPNFPTPELGPFVVMLCRRIGAALGVSWQVVLRDFSESTYSSARTDKLDAYQTWDALQYLFIEQDLVPEWQEVMSDAILRGERELLAAGVALADVQEVEWVPNGRPWIDPLREAESIKLKIEMRLTSRTAECAKMGGDYPTVLEQQLQDELLERERRQALGLPAAAPAQAPGFPRLPAPAPSDASDASDDSDADPDNGNGNGNGHRPRARGLLSLLRRTN